MKQKMQFNKNIVVFKRWTGKRYAILQSLNKCLKIGVLSAAYTLTTSTVKAEGKQNTTTPNQEYETIDEVIITGDAVSALSEKDAQAIEVISSEDIQSLAAQSVEDLLDYALNIDLRRRGRHGIQSDISLRGGTFEQTLILLNGININDPQTGHFSMNIPFDVNNIKRIEILKPGAAKLYGSGAFTGAVNFIIEPDYTSNSSVHYAHGSYGNQQIQAISTYTNKRLSQSISGGYAVSDGYIENTDFEKKNILYQGKWGKKNLDINWQTGYLDKGFGANSFYTPVFPNQYETNKTLLSGIALSYGTRIKFKPKLYWRRNYDHFILFRDQPELYQNYHRTDVYGSNMQFYIPVTNDLKIISGMHYRSENIVSNNLGKNLSSSVNIEGSDSTYHKSYERDNINTYINLQYKTEKISFTPLLSINHNNGTGSTDLLPSLNITMYMTEHTMIYTNMDRSIRNPSFTDLFYQGKSNIGNTELKPEYANTYEMGSKYAKNIHLAQASVFYRQGNHIIDWMKHKPEEKWQTQNITTLNTLGFDLLYSINLRKQSSATLPFIDKLTISYSYTSIEKADTDYFSNYALDNLKHKATGKLYITILPKLKFSLSAYYQDRNGGFKLYDIVSGTYSTYAYAPFLTADMKLSYTYRWTKLYGQISNIMDKKYYDIGNVIQAGRWTTIGLIVTLQY